MKQAELFNLLEIDDIMKLPDALMEVLMGDADRRTKFYRAMLELNGFDVSFDWFQSIYEDEMAQRKKQKQDFTPNSVSVLCSMIVGNHSSVHEPTAGNGSMLIADWWENAQKDLVYTYRPSRHMIDCWELSDRSLPILLFNLSVRGIMGVVHHGDVLEQQEKCRYILLNRHDDPLAFSEIIVDNEKKLKIGEV